MKSFHVFLSTHVSASALHLGVAYSKGSTTPPCSALLSKSASRLQPPASYSVIAGCIKTFQMQSYDTDTLFRRGGGVGGAPADGGHATAVASSTAALVGASDPRSTSSSDRNVPQTAFFNGQRITFGDYRRDTIIERTVIMLSAVVPVAWGAISVFRRLRTTWSKAVVAVIAPCLAWLLQSVLSWIYKATVLRPRLLPPESVAFPNSRFQDVNGLKVHSTWELPKHGKSGVPPRHVMHMNHGFGASSLSWAPVIKGLSEALGAVTVAHDSPGFGLTGRPGLWRTNQYSLRNNAAITGYFLRDATRELEESTGSEASSPHYILMGHSMGTISAAMAALDPALPPQQTTLVLVATAITPAGDSWTCTSSDDENGTDLHVTDARETEGPNFQGGSSLGSRMRDIWGRIFGSVIGVPLSGVRAIGRAAAWVFNWGILPLAYPLQIVMLRLLAYNGNFWRAGLRVAWFDNEAVDLNVINRYRWPTLVRNWDRGIALFLLQRSQIGQGGTSGPSRLIKAIANKASEGMKVIVVQGEDDKVINLTRVQKGITDVIPGAKMIVIPRCGHVPHEEEPETFMRLLLEALGTDATPNREGSTSDAVES